MPRVNPPSSPVANPNQERRRELQRLRNKLTAERAAWARWLPRLKRAFNVIIKIEQRLRRLERQMANLSQS